MSVAASEVSVATLLEGDEALTEQQWGELVERVRGGARQREKFAAEFVEAVKSRASGLMRSPVRSLKVAQGYFALEDFGEGAKWCERAGSGPQQSWLRAGCLRESGDYEGAVAEFEQAEQKGYDPFDVSMAVVDCLRRKGALEEAEGRLKKAARVGEIRAEYHYQLGCLYDAQGKREESLAEYERAVTLDGNHARALFALAYGHDIYGDEAKAIEYYQRCLAAGHLYVHALLNLAVLYEDASRYEEAWECVQEVLAVYPNHARAKLFLQDIESSLTMYYDEEQEKRVDRRNQVLMIPISDFELSVRSRNCLKRMNIRTLGDLLKVTEPDLLAYKNFGETSLLEVKSILASKGLRLGQMLEDRKEVRPAAADGAAAVNEEIMQMPVSALELSVRVRKALQRLNLNTLGDLAQCTEAELLGCKNFGQTSLAEVSQRLKEKGLSLRKLEE